MHTEEIKFHVCLSELQNHKKRYGHNFLVLAHTEAQYKPCRRSNCFLDYFLNKLETLQGTNARMFQPEHITSDYFCQFMRICFRVGLGWWLSTMELYIRVIRHTEHTKIFYVKISITISFLYLLYTFVQLVFANLSAHSTTSCRYYTETGWKNHMDFILFNLQCRGWIWAPRRIHLVMLQTASFPQDNLQA